MPESCNVTPHLHTHAHTCTSHRVCCNTLNSKQQSQRLPRAWGRRSSSTDTPWPPLYGPEDTCLRRKMRCHCKTQLGRKCRPPIPERRGTPARLVPDVLAHLGQDSKQVNQLTNKQCMSRASCKMLSDWSAAWAGSHHISLHEIN